MIRLGLFGIFIQFKLVSYTGDTVTVLPFSELNAGGGFETYPI